MLLSVFLRGGLVVDCLRLCSCDLQAGAGMGMLAEVRCVREGAAEEGLLEGQSGGQVRTRNSVEYIHGAVCVVAVGVSCKVRRGVCCWEEVGGVRLVSCGCWKMVGVLGLSGVGCRGV